MVFMKQGNTEDNSDRKRGIFMESEKNHALQGEDNKRLSKSDEQNNEGTAAWTNTKKSMPKSQVSIPGEDAVIHAKEWVDNGSRL